MNLPRTPSQTVGPFFEFGLSRRPAAGLAEPGSDEAIRIEGRVLDGAGDPVPDGLVEIWQADGEGRYDSSWGWGRCPTDADGHFAFTTVKPGGVREPGGGVQAPHVTALVFARGLLKPVLTRIYFADEDAANAGDPVLSSIADPAERATLLATPTGAAGYRFDVKLQGDGQTVFFTTPASGL